MKELKKSAKIILPLSMMVVIFGVVGIVNGWNNVQNANHEVELAKQNVIKGCQDTKAAMLNPDLPSDAYQNHLPDFNAQCAKYVGALS